MQRIRFNGKVKNAIFISLIIVAIVFLILLDQSTKVYFKILTETTDWKSTTVIDGFFYFKFTYNSAAAFSLFDFSWSQTFFRILTPIALVGFIVILFYAFRKKYKLLLISISLIISGTIGNFIDRLRYEKVIDFISLVFGSYNYPIFNLADSFMTVGIVLLIIHFLFLDNNAIFKKNGKKNSQSK